MSTICFYAQFTASRAGLDGLTVTWDVERITRADGTRSALVTGGANGITVGRRGLYGYVLTGADLATYDYIATAITTSTTADVKEVPAIWTLYSMNDYLDAAITSRLAPTTAGRTLDVTATGAAGIDWGNVENQTTAVELSATITNLVNSVVSVNVTAGNVLFSDETSLDSKLIGMETKVNALPADPADQSAVEAAITAATSPLATAASITTLRGADSDTLKTLSDQIDDLDPMGAGSVATVITINDGTNPLDGVDVWASTDSGGTNVVERRYTNASGQVTLYLDPGTYYIWKTLSGYNFTNPSTLVVT